MSADRLVPSATLRVLGEIATETRTGRRQGASLAGRQGRVVLAALAAADRPLHRDVLADRVWGDHLPASWARDLSSVVSRLRATLGRLGVGAGAIVGGDGTYRLDASVLTSDLAQLRDLVPRSESCLAAGELDRARELAEQAAGLVAGAFLPNEDADWATEVRTEVAHLTLRAREVAAEALVGTGRHLEALRRYTEIVQDAPLHEPAHRRLVELLARAGNRAQAAAAYEHLRTLLADELGVDPSPETEAAYLRVLRDRHADAPPTTVTAPAPGVPTTEYARSGNVNIAYQVVGTGPDLVMVPGWVSNVELLWQEPRAARFLHRLAERCRLILFDKRGTGLSDPVPIDHPPLVDDRLDDIATVMDAAGSDRASLLGFSEGGTLAILAAATHADRARGLLLWGAWARQLPTEDFPHGWTREEGLRRFVRPLQKLGRVDPRWFAPSVAEDPDFLAWFTSYGRQSASPGMAISLLRSNAQMDVRHVLPSLDVPTLVLHHTDDVLVDLAQGRYLAAHVPGARLREFPGRDHWPWIGPDADAIADEIADFVVAAATSPEHVTRTTLATVVAVGSRGGTEDIRATVGDAGGRVLEADAATVVVGFERPGRAVDWAVDVAASGHATAAHTGEVVRTPAGGVDGPAPRTVRDLLAVAAPGDVLVTRPLRDLLAGSPTTFTAAGVDAPVDLPWPVFVAAVPEVH